MKNTNYFPFIGMNVRGNVRSWRSWQRIGDWHKTTTPHVETVATSTA